MEVFDTQAHIWEEKPRRGRPWDASFPHDLRDRPAVTHGTQVAVMDAVGVATVAVNVMPHYRRRRPDGSYAYDNSYAEEATAKYPGRFYSVPWLDPSAPDIYDTLSGLLDRPGVLGGRVVFGTRDLRRAAADGRFDPLFRVAGRRGIPLFVASGGRVRFLRTVATRHPNTLIIVDSLGLPVPQLLPMRVRRTTDPFDRLPDLLRLAEHPNIAVKWAGAPRLSRQPYPYLDIWPHLLRVVEAFTPARLMFATDWTICRDLHTYAEAVFYLRETDELSHADKEQILGTTARQLLPCSPDPAPAY